MMSKIKLFLDVDNTITNSSKAICKSYNFLYKDEKGFKPANWIENEKYNFSEICPLINNPAKLFRDELFFRYLEFMGDNTCDIIRKLNEKYQVIICSIGHPKNISLKSLWLNDKLSFIKDYILLYNDGCKMDKSIVDMSNGIFIDDCTSNLDSSNAELKVIFGDEYEWSQTKDYTRCWNWTDVAKLLL